MTVNGENIEFYVDRIAHSITDDTITLPGVVVPAPRKKQMTFEVNITEDAIAKLAGSHIEGHEPEHYMEWLLGKGDIIASIVSEKMVIEIYDSLHLLTIRSDDSEVIRRAS